MITLWSGSYVFNPTAQTIQFSSGFEVSRLIQVVNLTRGVIVYSPNMPGASLADWDSNTLTVKTSFATRQHNENDLLQILYDVPGGGGGGASLSAPVFSTLFASTYYASESIGSPVTLDLKEKQGAWVYANMGRVVSNAMIRPSYLAIRPTHNSSAAMRFPGSGQDLNSSIGACSETTLNGAVSLGDTTAILTSATGFAVGDIVCFSSPDTSANRVEFAKILSISSNTLTFERPLLLAHNNADRVTNIADSFGRIWLPGGDIYQIVPANPSNRAVIWQAAAAVQG